MKSERLKKLEAELVDLEQWLKLGLVPKKDIDRHKEEIRQLTVRIEEERERLKFLKESGEMEENLPRRPVGRAAYAETPSMSDIDLGEEGLAERSFTETGLDIETEAMENETSFGEEKGEEEEVEEEEEEEEEDPFSDRNRWRRGNIVDPEASDW